MTVTATIPGMVGGMPGTEAGISYEAFLNRPGDLEHLEWVQGKVVPMSPVSREHADVGLFLLSLIKHYVEAKDLGAVLFEPFQMKTGPDLPGRAPDILFVAKANLERLHPLFLEGPGDLVVEIISPGSRAVDRGEKFFEYEQGGVPEYWLIDPQRQQAEFYQRGANGIYRLVPVDSAGRYRSRVLEGLWLEVTWLWQRPLPSLVGVLRAWRLI
ncbi:MAG: Uma2 family endonuclease [Verrucomicrobia bacterium]|nr:Uma2 family endonuclease [Verrucomicrobiota bacterium]